MSENPYKKVWKELGKKLKDLNDKKAEEIEVAREYENHELIKQLERELFMVQQIHNAYTTLNTEFYLKESDYNGHKRKNKKSNRTP